MDITPELKVVIRWHIGEASSVDDTRARVVLERVADDEDVLAIMLLARVYSTARTTFPANKARAIEIAGSVIAEVWCEI